MRDRWLAEGGARAWIGVVVGVHVMVRIGAWLAGVPLVTFPLTRFWQVADPALLREDLWGTVWHLHAQPPLWNLWVGLVWQLPETLHEPVHRLALAVGGLVVVGGVWWLARRLGARPWLAGAAALLVSLSPSLLAWELFAFYALPVAALLVVFAVAVGRVETAAAPSLVLAVSGTAAVIALTRSLFHLVWVVVVVLVVLAWRGRPSPGQVAAGVLPVLLVVGWYGHVAQMTGVFGASTWFGMSLGKAYVSPLDGADRAALVAEGRLHPIALEGTFQAPYHYADLVELPEPTGRRLWDDRATSTGVRNLHNLGVVPASAAFATAAKQAVRAQPAVVVRQVGSALCFSLRPGHAYDLLVTVNDAPVPDLLADDAAKPGMDGWRAVYDRAVLLTPVLETERSCSFRMWEAGWQTISPTAIVLVAAPLLLSAAALWRRFRGQHRDGDLVLVVSGLTVAFVLGVGTLVEVSENYRFRWLVESYGWVALAVTIERWLRRRATTGPRA